MLEEKVLEVYHSTVFPLEVIDLDAVVLSHCPGR